MNDNEQDEEVALVKGKEAKEHVDNVVPLPRADEVIGQLRASGTRVAVNEGLSSEHGTNIEPLGPHGTKLGPAATADTPRRDKPRSGRSGVESLDELPAITSYGRFELLGRLAVGGMAEIFLARERSGDTARYLVLKRVLPHVAMDDKFVEMFLDEARLAMHLNHPNICHIYEFGTQDRSSFIAMEWVNGVTLGRLAKKARSSGGLPAAIAAKIAAGVAGALHYAHTAKDRQGRPLSIVHRDVSPHNIMVSYEGAVKLLDFGIAKANTQRSKTEAGALKGKFAYMAPEQCLSGEVDSRTDVFALGVCLYEALTGHYLYRGETQYDTLRAIIEDPVPSVRRVSPTVPRELDAIVQKCLSKRPADRYQSAGELQTALEEWLVMSRQVVTQSRLGQFLEELYGEEVRQGPLVDAVLYRDSIVPGGATKSVDEASGSDFTVSAVQSRSSVVRGAAMGAAALAVVAGVLWGLSLGNAEHPSAGSNDPSAPPSFAATANGGGPAETGAPTAAAAEALARAVGSIAVRTVPSGAVIKLDGKVVGVSPMNLPSVASGEHELRLEVPDHEPYAQTITVTEGETFLSDVTLRAQPTSRPAATRAPRAQGQLSLNTRPWSKVYLGSRLLGTTPLGEVPVPAGRLTLKLVDRDGQVHRKTVNVSEDRVARAFFELSE